jgi:hypothetical protein
MTPGCGGEAGPLVVQGDAVRWLVQRERGIGDVRLRAQDRDDAPRADQ